MPFVLVGNWPVSKYGLKCWSLVVCRIVWVSQALVMFTATQSDCSYGSEFGMQACVLCGIIQN